MELGNMIFGHSRGQDEIPREDEWHEPLSAVLEACGCDSYGWPRFENDTFMVQGYDWDAECDCGFSERTDAWHKAHPHAPECYDSVMNKIMEEYDARTKYKEIEHAAFEGDHSLLGGMNIEGEDIVLDGHVVGKSMIMTPRKDAYMGRWRTAHDLRESYQDEQRKRLCGERGLSYPAGCAVHCDCYKEKAAHEWFSANDHAPTCRVVQPNFLYKPTGFRVMWYKYPLRDSYMTPPVDLAGWCEIMEACRGSVRR